MLQQQRRRAQLLLRGNRLMSERLATWLRLHSKQIPFAVVARLKLASTLGSLPACACATSSYPTAVLPRGLMNSRRLMGLISLAEIHLLESLIRSSNESYTLHRSAVGGLMSVSGQTRTLDNVRVTSVKLLIAD